MANIFSKVWNFFKGLITRPGLQPFLQKHLPLAVSTILDLSRVNSNAAFHVWKDQAFLRLKGVLGDVHDNWISILIGIAVEELKAKGKL